jgi:hypothetical protein
MNEQQNLQTVQQTCAAFVRGDIQAILGNVAPDVEWVFPGPKQVPFAGTFRGPEQVAQLFALVGENLEFEQYEPREFIAQGDKVVVLGQDRYRVRSTGGSAGGEWVAAFTLRDGKIARHHYYCDTAALEAAFRTR